MWQVIISWFLINWSSFLTVLISLIALTVSIGTLWWAHVKPFSAIISLAGPAHLTPRLQNLPYRLLYVPLRFENRGAKPGWIEDILLEVAFPNGSTRNMVAVTSREHEEDPPGKDYLSAKKGALYPQIHLAGHGHRIVGILFKPAAPPGDWYTGGEVRFTIKAKPDNVLWYTDVGAFSFKFSPELLTAIQDCADKQISILLQDIKQVNMQRRTLSLPEHVDSFAGVAGDQPLPDSVNALASRYAIDPRSPPLTTIPTR